MKKFGFTSIVLFLLVLVFNSLQSVGPAVTYKVAGGRWGDQLLNYIKSRWTARTYCKKKNGRPADFLYKPFEGSDKLVMHKKEMKYATAVNRYSKVVKLKNDALKGFIAVQDNTVYETNYYLKIPELDDYTLDSLVDPLFWQEMRAMITPITPIKKVALPHDIITVAVHIRRGSGKDKPLFAEQDKASLAKAPSHQKYLDLNWPDKSPSVNFYIDQIKKLSALLDGQRMYVYIFTDDKNPQDLVERIDAALGMLNVELDYRKEQVDAVDDFFAMTEFDCLIRSNSNFSKCVEPLGDYKIVIYPKHAYWDGKEAVVDDVGIKINRK